MSQETKESFTNLNNNDIINSNFDTIIFNFDLNNSADPNFAFYIYETENTIFKRYNGSVFPKTLLEKKIIKSQASSEHEINLFRAYPQFFS